MSGARLVAVEASGAPCPLYHDTSWIDRSGQRFGFAARDDHQAATVVAALTQVLMRSLDDTDKVAITGRGILAELLTAALGAPVAVERAQTVIDTTGDPDRLDATLVAMPSLGRLLLPIPTPGIWAPDLYPDVHRRGLVLKGICWPTVDATPRKDQVERALGCLVTRRIDEVPAGGELWNRLEP